MLFAVDKPSGITSFDVIRELKKTLPPKTKIGHSGTLDPLASGLMLVGVTKEGTKLLHHLQGLDKTYETTIDFSQHTDTRDVDFWNDHIAYELVVNDEQQAIGIKKDNTLVQAPSLEQIETSLADIVPSGLLPLTPFSAKKINGQKMYDLARSGKPVFVDQEMVVHSARVLQYAFPTIDLEISVGSGTYIRSIGHRLGRSHGLGGILTQLRRTRIDTYDIQQMGGWQKAGNVLYTPISYV